MKSSFLQAGTYKRHRRCGATMVESAIVLSAMLTLLIGIVDLGLGVLHYNTMSEAARRLARRASVRGEMASPEHATWGPAAYEGTCSDGSPQAQTIEPVLIAVDPHDVSFQIEWMDGGYAVDDRVRATISLDYQPILPTLWGGGNYTLSASSTMRIAH